VVSDGSRPTAIGQPSHHRRMAKKGATARLRGRRCLCLLSADSSRSLSREQPTGFDPEPSFATPEQEYFDDGMVEAIITALSRIR
jgi:hypothetical protein